MTAPRSPLRIGNAHGFWGDRIEAAAEMLAREPELDYLTLDFLAEVSMSILAVQRERDPEAGFARDFVDVVASLAPYWTAGGRCRVVTNAGGLNPRGCAEACRKALEAAGVTDRTIAIVAGDDVLPMLRSDLASSAASDWADNLDTQQPISAVADRLITASAYVGAEPIVDALARGADIVITGRVADPSLTLGPCRHHFGWRADDWDRLAGGTVAGHLIECGAQATGGISTDWLEVPDVASIGFPIVEVAEDGSCVVTKPRGSGGRVTELVVKEQLVYEIGDPGRYLSPDVTVSFLGLTVTDQGGDRVLVTGARGSPAPDRLKVSATYRDGFRAAGTLTIVGDSAPLKACRAAEAVFESLRRRKITFAEQLVECLGTGACRIGGISSTAEEGEPSGDAIETVLRMAVADPDRRKVEAFTRSLTPLITAGPPGVTGYAEGRPRVHPVLRYWPCLIPRERVVPRIEILAAATPKIEVDRPPSAPVPAPVNPVSSQSKATSRPPITRPPRLSDIACARSGDKGTGANIGVLARAAEHYPRLVAELTADRVADYFGVPPVRVQRYELPRLQALNFVVAGILASSLRTDAQGKSLGQQLLLMPLAAPAVFEGSLS
ncbi:acyclic terpene utilization AtuA family protein [Planctomyces sp. SH-PL14]|uniref:acyclic terpene utilization AtuA family protein n=1 Tax=Planctomyces sp. SH-PL14 TaxID=1632864 RepID=UPI00078E0D43|nr:acyclic terpene utilization AtuA family protein [Planctomyces sp. SH-PL14]AMV19422.1 hypothetical protein VT03_16130 [Planctomyces sp. SH-PL14]